MQLIKLLFTFTLIIGTLPLSAQSCDSEVCRTILRLKNDLKTAKLKIDELNRKAKEMEKIIADLKKNEVKNKQQIELNYTDLILYKEQFVKAQLRLEGIEIDLEEAIAKLKEKPKSKEEQEFLENLEYEKQQQIFINEGVTETTRRQEQDIANRNILDTWLPTLELGYGSQDNMTIVKRIKKGRATYVTKGFHDLDLINFEGEIWVSLDKDLRNKKGKLILYADDKLQEVIDVTLQEVKPPLNMTKTYQIKGSALKLSKPFPDNVELRAGYVDIDTYYKEKNYFSKFWDAQSQGKFLATNIKPVLPLKESKDLLNDCTLIPGSKISTRSEVLYFAVRDNKDVDGDIAAIYLNDEKIEELELKKDFSQFRPIYLSRKSNKITLIPISEGSVGQCTVEISIQEGKKKSHEITISGNRSQTQCIEIEKL